MVIQTILVNPTYLDIGNGSKSTTLVLDFAPHIDIYSISGTATLLTNLAITTSSIKSAKIGQVFELRYGATITPNTFSFSILGNTVPERLLDSKFVALCTYNGSTWDVLFLPDLKENSSNIGTGNIEDDAITTAKIAAGAVDSTEIAAAAVVSAKIADGSVTVEKLEDEAKETAISIPKIFDYSAKTTFKLPIPVKCELVRIVFVVSETAIGATNDATMSISGDSAGSIFSGSIVANASAAVGSKITLTPASTTNLVQGEILSFTPDGSQTTGKIVAAAAIMRLAD